MKYLALACALLLGSCARHSPHTAAPKSEPIGAIQPPVDTEFVRINSANPAENGPSRPGVLVQPPRNLLDKITGRTPPAQYYPPGTPVFVKGNKNTLTVNNVTGGQSNNTAGKNAVAGTGATGGKADGPVAGTGGTATAIEKAKAPVGTGTGDVTDNTKQGQRGGAAASAPGATATATTIKPPTPLLKYGLWSLGALGGYWLLFGGGGALLLALWRKNKPTENQA